MQVRRKSQVVRRKERVTFSSVMNKVASWRRNRSRSIERSACVVPHCDPTVNLYDVYHAVRGDTLEAIWPVDARGKSA